MKKWAAPTIAVVLSSLALGPGIGWTSEAAAGPGSGPAKTLATVNGVAITEDDVRQSLRRASHEEKVPEAASRTVLQTVVRDELIYQQAVALGLDADPAYQKKLAEAQAQLRAFQRDSLRSLYQEHVRAQVSVTEPEARAYFDENADRIRTKVHVLQITRKNEAEQLAQDAKDLKSGAAFAEVASRRFVGMPTSAKKPWDLGYLHWTQIPEPWRATLHTMAPGQVSDVIQGPGGRAWIIQLVDKIADPAVTFDTEKERIDAVLRDEKRAATYDALIRRLTEQAKIVFSAEEGTSGSGPHP